MLPPATASHHHYVLPALEVSVTNISEEIVEHANDNGIPYSYFKDVVTLQENLLFVNRDLNST